MNNSPTEGVDQSPASNELTGQTTEQLQSAEQSNQDANSREQSQGKVSDDTAQQNQNSETQKQTQQGDANQTDDGLAKFAKAQGFDLETASDDVKRALKLAHDNQRAYRNATSNKSISEATEELDDGSLRAEVDSLKYENQVNKFWQGKSRDRSLEPVMVEILNEKVAELTPQFGEEQARMYAKTLSRDLDTLYGLAQLRSGANTGTNIDAEAIRREERESINKQLQGGAPQAHAMQSGQSKKPQITAEWLTNVYNPRDPEHIKLLQEAGLRQCQNTKKTI